MTITTTTTAGLDTAPITATAIVDWVHDVAALTTPSASSGVTDHPRNGSG